MPRPFRLKGRKRLLRLAVVKSGGDAGLAKKLGISRQAVHQWNDVPPIWLSKVRRIANCAVQQ